MEWARCPACSVRTGTARPHCCDRAVNLATTYSRGTCRPTTIGAAAFHFRVRDGNGWFHRAMVTRGRPGNAPSLMDGKSGLSMGALDRGGIGNGFMGKNGSGVLLKGEFAWWGRSRGPVHWQLHMGCGKKMGSITFIHHSLAWAACAGWALEEVIRRVGKSSRTDD